MIIEIPENASAIYIFAHGAGAGMEHPFMQRIARGLNKQQIGTVRFNFPYLERGRKAPGSPEEAMNAIAEVFTKIKSKYDLPIYLGGKSYGGRMSSTAVANGLVPNAQGLIFFGFPLHPPGKPSTKRAEHLKEIKIPMLFLQGMKDKLATIELIREVIANSSVSKLVEFENADHSFKVPKKAILSQEEVYDKLVKEVVGWMSLES